MIQSSNDLYYSLNRKRKPKSTFLISGAFSLAATLAPNYGSVGPGLDFIGGLAKHPQLRGRL